MIRIRYWPFLCLLGLALASPAQQAKAQDGKRGYYMGMTGMYVIPGDAEIISKRTDLEFAGDFSVEGGLGFLLVGGYSFGTGFRGEIEIGYRQTDLDGFEGTTDANKKPAKGGAEGKLESVSVMINGFYDFQVQQLRPYVGIGVGTAQQELEFKSAAAERSGKVEDTVVAYQAMLGVGYPLSERIVIHAGYRYFGTGGSDADNVEVTYGGTHNFEAGVRYSF